VFYVVTYASAEETEKACGCALCAFVLILLQKHCPNYNIWPYISNGRTTEKNSSSLFLRPRFFDSCFVVCLFLC
jgi:hypothetical protein